MGGVFEHYHVDTHKCEGACFQFKSCIVLECFGRVMISVDDSFESPTKILFNII